MALFFSNPSSFSTLVLSHRYSAIPRNLVSETLFRRNLIRKTSSVSVSISASVNPCYFRCCMNSIDERRMRIFIKGLPRSTSEGSLKKLFSRFGEVSKVKIIKDQKFRQSLGFAYVWFTTEESAQLAANDMDGKFLDGRFVVVAIAKPESPTSRVKATPYQF
ncbi:hypothetical protein HHK36_021005 [Tetracentron sinense]|uniref:RRM domain-containing protein n=1 Tax=Tetracentron sinense TaxID=13715 RepID=A0A834YUB6_TETSI|nr:hypothetical protein HHK36_021005 [Tetracentron sinense]